MRIFDSGIGHALGFGGGGEAPSTGDGHKERSNPEGSVAQWNRQAGKIGPQSRTDGEAGEAQARYTVPVSPGT